MKIDAAFEFQEAWFTHLWAVDTIIPPVTLDRRGHCPTVMALVTGGQPGESWSLFSAFPRRHNVNRISCFVLGWGAINDAGGEPRVGEETLLSLQFYHPAMICRDFILSLRFLDKIHVKRDNYGCKPAENQLKMRKRNTFRLLLSCIN